MSTIDTGLGWSCDSDYYVADTTTLIGSDNQQNSYYKTTAGASIVGAYTTNYNTEAFAILSTNSDFATLSVQSALTHSTVVNGVTWYITTPFYGNGTVKATDFPYYTNTQIDVEFYENPVSLNAVVTMFLTAANVQSTAAQIATTDYVKTFVEGVEAETATRVNGISNAITPTFSTATSYAVGDYCIYDNGLYKCTTAHSGAWSAGDFTSVNVMSEIQNASGGGGENPHRIVYIKENGGTVTVTFPAGNRENLFYGEVRVAGANNNVFAPFYNTSYSSDTTISTYTTSNVGAINQGPMGSSAGGILVASTIIITRNKNTFTVKSNVSNPLVVDIYAIFA